ncbi:MAG: hypothetical protein ACJ74W_01400 [Pyrinomonadaceae bacterium]
MHPSTCRLLLLTLLFTLCLYAPARAQKRELPSAPDKNIHWTRADPRCDEILSDGDAIRIIHDGSITVAVVGYDSGDYTVVEVTVANATEQRFNVVPKDFFLTYLDRKGQADYIYSMPPEKIAAKFKSRARWGNFFRSFAAGMARTTTTESGAATIYGPAGVANGTYNGTSTAPNLAAQRAAAEANSRAGIEAEEKADRLMSGALKSNTLFPKTYASGFVYFRQNSYRAANLNMIIGDTLYSFALAGKSK